MKNGLSINQERDSYGLLMEALRDRINRAMHDNGMTQKALAAKAGLSQSTVSNMISGKKEATIKEIFTLMELLDMEPLKVLADCIGDASVPDSLAYDAKPTGPAPLDRLLCLDGFITDPGAEEFHGQAGEFHTYFLATNRYDDSCVRGILRLEEKYGRCAASLELVAEAEPTKEQGEKKLYHGFAVISSKQKAVYILLAGNDVSELCFLSYPHQAILAKRRRLECTMAVAATVSSGADSRRPTIHRMFLSRRALTAEAEEQIRGQLKLNHSSIMILKKNFLAVCAEASLSPEFIDRFMKACKTAEYYEIDEGSLKELEKTSHTYFRDLSFLRKYSTAPKNNKIHTGTIGDIFRYILSEIPH